MLLWQETMAERTHAPTPTRIYLQCCSEEGKESEIGGQGIDDECFGMHVESITWEKY